MRLGIKGFLIIFAIYFGLGVLFSSAIAEEKTENPPIELNCQAFVSEKICNMTDAEREIHFLELLKKILEDTLEAKKEGLDV